MVKDIKSKIFYGYVIVAVSLFILIIMHGVPGTFGVFFGSLQTELAANRATIASANSLSFLIGGLFGIIMGRLTDRFGPKVVIAGSGIILGIAYLLMSTVTSLWQLYLFYSVMAGIGASSGNVSLLSTTTRWFVKRRGLMTAIVKVGTGAGMFIMPVMASWLISSYDWRKASVVLGIIGFVGIVPLAFLLKRDPEKMGLQPYGADDATAVSKSNGGVQLSLKEAMRTRQFWLLCSAYFLAGYTTQSLMIHLVPYATDSGIPIVQAATVVSGIGGISIAGRLVMGSAGDKFGNKWALLGCFTVILVAILWLQLASSLWMLYLFAIVYGFGHGGFYAVMSPMVAELFGTRSHGVNFGMVLFLQSAGIAVGPVATGFLYDTLHSYNLAFLILIAVSGSALILTLTIKSVRKKASDL